MRPRRPLKLSNKPPDGLLAHGSLSSMTLTSGISSPQLRHLRDDDDEACTCAHDAFPLLNVPNDLRERRYVSMQTLTSRHSARSASCRGKPLSVPTLPVGASDFRHSVQLTKWTRVASFAVAARRWVCKDAKGLAEEKTPRLDADQRKQVKSRNPPKDIISCGVGTVHLLSKLPNPLKRA